MSDEDIQRLIELAKFKMQQPITPREALQSLIDAGLVDEQGNMTAPYRELLEEE